MDVDFERRLLRPTNGPRSLLASPGSPQRPPGATAAALAAANSHRSPIIGVRNKSMMLCLHLEGTQAGGLCPLTNPATSLPTFQDKNRLYHDPQTGCQSIGSWSWGRDKGKSYLEKGVKLNVGDVGSFFTQQNELRALRANIQIWIAYSLVLRYVTPTISKTFFGRAIIESMKLWMNDLILLLVS